MRVKIAAAAVVLAGAGFGVYAYSSAASAQPAITQTVVASSVNPSVSGQSVTFTATVSEVPAGAIPTGSVTFTIPGAANPCQGGTGTESLSPAGVAQCTTTVLNASEDATVNVVANYLGDPNNAPSTSNTVAQSVGQASTSLALTSTAVVPPVTQTGCTVASGSVNVSCQSLTGVTVGAAVSDTGGLIQAGTTVVTLVKHPLTGQPSLTLSLPAAGSTTPTESLTFQSNPQGLYPSGHSARYTATLNVTSPGGGSPSGTVTFTITPHGGGSPIACANGTAIAVSRLRTATCVVPPGQLVAGGAPFTVAAAYSGDLSYTSSLQNGSQGIQPLASKTYLAGNPMPPPHGAPVHFTAAVVPSQSGVTPTGTIGFTFTSQPITVTGCTLTASPPKVSGCAIPLADLQVGEVVTDSTTPGDIPSSPLTTVVSIGTNAVTLSQAPTSDTGQKIVFTPASTPTITCDGGSNTVALTPTGATCSLSGGLPQAGSPFDVVAAYSGDANDALSSSHALLVKVR